MINKEFMIKFNLYINLLKLNKIKSAINDQSSNYKVAIITGASKGIGRSTAIKFLNNNLKCVLVSRKINNEFKNF